MAAEAEKGVSTPSEEVNIAREDDAKTTSDNDTAERPVRRKLKETRITSDSHAAAEGNSSDEGSANRGRLTTKRSRDDMQADEDEDDVEQGSGNGHRRKRSRDSKDGEAGIEKEDVRKSTPEPTHNDESSHILSPKKKRSLDQLVKDSENVTSEDKENVEKSDKSQAEGEREKKRHRDASEERRDAAAASTKSSLPKSFLNTSAISPFASLGAQSTEGEEAKNKVTSSSSFAASGLASFAKSEQSPFGTLGSSTPSVFKAADSASSEKPATSGFAAAAGASPFASTAASGFASLGSGLGSGFGGGFGSGSAGKLSSFASASGPAFGGSSTSKPFGAAADSDAEEDEGEEDNAVASFEKEKEDERFYEQQIETGEEEEQTYFSSKAKLFHFTNKEWKERGVGTFKINVKEEAGAENDKVSARMIMRADGVLRVMLNSPIFKGMPVGDVTGEEPKTKQLNLASIENGTTTPLLLRLGRPESAKELYHIICDLQKRL
ncbi:hypothetical protein PISL3812_03809 [Talaromyces islandicus]|uniref:RanBD1 domain-containing protein n=1 Tax=Talaromyces islandicus TaxID=28573 RepID=A0A0U1LTQ8_TALIS|nr:hypothetical protein PISL3812_03809 [Talaromyces islandicus]